MSEEIEGFYFSRELLSEHPGHDNQKVHGLWSKVKHAVGLSHGGVEKKKTPTASKKKSSPNAMDTRPPDKKAQANAKMKKNDPVGWGIETMKERPGFQKQVLNTTHFRGPAQENKNYLRNLGFSNENRNNLINSDGLRATFSRTAGGHAITFTKGVKTSKDVIKPGQVSSRGSYYDPFTGTMKKGKKPKSSFQYVHYD